MRSLDRYRRMKNDLYGVDKTTDSDYNKRERLEKRKPDGNQLISFAADNDGTGIYFMKGSSLMRNWKNKILLIMSMVMVLCLFIVPFAYSEECGIGTAASCEKVTDTEDIPYETEYRLDTNRYPESGNKLIQAGQNGIKNCNYRITYENGIKTGRYDLGVEITEPVKEIISIPGKEHIIETKEETVTEPVAFSTETVDDPDRIKGDPDIVVQEGKDGEKTIIIGFYYFIYYDEKNYYFILIYICHDF